MIKAEFGKIADRIGNGYRDPFTEAQFEEWYKTFGAEDYQTVDEAVTLMLKEYKWFPVLATLWSYIDRVRETQEAKTNTGKQEAPLSGEELKEATDKGARWSRFIRYLLFTRIYPKTREECYQMKAKFEKEHPNWKPRREAPEKKGKLVSIGK